MNARKYAWQILHATIRRMTGADEGVQPHPQNERIADLFKQAANDKINDAHIILSLAEFATSFLYIHANNPQRIECPSCGKPFEVKGADPLPIAKAMGDEIMKEPD